jgi:hypothetical protein
MRTTWVISAAIAFSAATFTAGGAPAKASTSPTASTSPAKASTSPTASTPTTASTSPAKASITATPAAIYAPTPLCQGSSHPTSATVTGTGFPASTPYTVTYNAKKPTTVTGTTTATGAFTASIANVDQPDGYYPVKARAGAASALTWVATNGYTCVTAKGTPNALNWKWQGAGFDAATTANMLMSGSVYYSTKTGTNGAFNVAFTAACPGQGNLPIDFQVTVQGKQQTINAGTLDCS